MARHEQIIGICDISVVSQQFSVKLKVSESGYLRSACGGLIAEARAKGVPLEHVAEQLLEEALAGRPSSRCKMSVAEFHEMLDCMAEGSERLPSLSTESFSRESFYEDRVDGGDAIPRR